VFGQQEGYRGTVTARLSLRASLMMLLLGVSACGSSQYVNRGAELYAGGYYIEAAEVFERTEKRLDQASAAEQAQYGLYRGATLLALGDSRRARRWLRYSERLLQSDAGLLSEEERDMLRRALGVLARHEPAESAPVRRDAGTAMIH
jgi:tetratricopeptide (TPR) repeat protein